MLLQLINTDIKVHMACPGFVNTSMIRNAQKKAVRCSLLLYSPCIGALKEGPFPWGHISDGVLIRVVGMMWAGVLTGRLCCLKVAFPASHQIS